MNMNQWVRQNRSKRTLRLALIAVSLLVMLAFGIQSTLAYLTDRTAAVENTFISGRVTTEVVESLTEEDSEITVKEHVQIKNTGNVPAFIRAAIVITWRDASGNLSGERPVSGTDYEMSLGSSEWEGRDGFWYYRAPVAPGAKTEDLITSIVPKADKSGYTLSVEILGSGIQSMPSSAVVEAWGVSVGNDGKLEVTP